MKRVTAIILAAVCLLSLCSCTGSKGVEPQESTLTAMNTVMSLRLYTGKDVSDTVSALEEEIKYLDALLTVVPSGNDDDASETVKINNSAEPVTVSDFTVGLINKALEANEITDGAFDITINPLVQLWGFNDGTYGVPGKAERENALKLVGSDKITVDGNSVSLKELSSITFGGIAKGALGDELMRVLNQKRIPAVLSLGGNIVLVGKNPNGKKWSVGVKAPEDEKALICTFVSDGDCSVVTSGGYERYFKYKGETYHHIIDPATGAPAKSDLLSVTVKGKDGAMCDALSTALFVMGSEKAVEFAKEHGDFEYIFITDEKVIASESLENLEVKFTSYSLETF